MANYGFVYLMTNDCMPNIFKIGYTDRSPLQRAEELSTSTSIPTSFEVFYYIECEEPRSVEYALHEEFSEHRISENREFFRFDNDYIHENVIPAFNEHSANSCDCENYMMSLWYYKKNKESQGKENGKD